MPAQKKGDDEEGGEEDPKEVATPAADAPAE